MYVRLNRQYWDSNFKELTKEITTGSAKGVYTNQIQTDLYEDHIYRLQSLLYMHDIDNKNFLCLTYEPVLYLESGLEYNTMSAWNFDYNREELNKILREYYDIHNNNYPDLIFALNEEDIIPIVENGYKKTEGFGSYLFIKE